MARLKLAKGFSFFCVSLSSVELCWNGFDGGLDETSKLVGKVLSGFLVSSDVELAGLISFGCSVERTGLFSVEALEVERVD